MTGPNLKYKRTIHKCLARREKKEPQEPESNRYAENYKRWISFRERDGGQQRWMLHLSKAMAKPK